MISEWHVNISGRVQGVGYRYSVLRYVANNLPEIRGYVANLYDGSVEVVATGSEEDLNKLIDFCSQGPRACRVDNITIEKEEVANHKYPNFFIKGQ